MTKTLIQSGPCRFETRVTAERVAKRKVKVTVETQCPNMQKMFAGWVAENGDELDPYKFCMSRPGQDALHTYAAAHLPPTPPVPSWRACCAPSKPKPVCALRLICP